MKWKWLLLLPILLLLIYLITIHLAIQKTAANKPKENAAYMILLGAKVNGEEMSLALQYRAKEAVKYLQDNKETTVIVTGGQGAGEAITEAEAVSRFLLDNGIEKERIIKEERSTSTYENLKFAKTFIEEDHPEVLIVSNDFHLFRASLIAKRLEMKPDTLAADTPQIVKLKLNIREYAAIAKTFLLDH